MPEAPNAASFDAFSWETFVNGLVFSGDDFGGDGGGVSGTDSTMGLVGIGGGVVGEMCDKGADVAPMFRLRCISNPPTYYIEGRINRSISVIFNATIYFPWIIQHQFHGLGSSKEASF